MPSAVETYAGSQLGRSCQPLDKSSPARQHEVRPPLFRRELQNVSRKFYGYSFRLKKTLFVDAVFKGYGDLGLQRLRGPVLSLRFCIFALQQLMMPLGEIG